MIITIDGPVATGKSSIAKKLSEATGFIYFDTGAMYRCVTYALIQQGIDIDNLMEIQTFLEHFTFEIKILHGKKFYFIGTDDVTEKIRSHKVTTIVSKVSAIRIVREKLVALQRSLASGVNAIFEGRDMGSFVFPKAELKIFLSGRLDVRAKRRFEELRAKFPEHTKYLTIEQTIADISARDESDSTRKISPLCKADDAYIIDTSDVSVEEIIFQILDLKEKLLTKEG